VSADKGRRLGRGLEALLGRHDAPTATAAPGAETPLREIPVGEIRPNPYQPRTEFREEEIDELKESLSQNGLLQPITVRPAGVGFELIAGERRLRAAVALGWRQISAIVRPIDDRTALTLALVENLQRSDLNPIEEAEGYQRLATEFQLSSEQIAQAVGKHRTTVVNALRLLHLPERVQGFVRKGAISAGHGRAILSLSGDEQRTDAALVAIARGFSVRNIEEYVRQRAGAKKTAAKTDDTPLETEKARPQVRDIEDRLRAYLQTDVRVDLSGPESGTISVRFYSSDDLERVLELMTGPAEIDEAH
jgi:ParB family transcriptional regulator, chromosome partitioning protein